MKNSPSAALSAAPAAVTAATAAAPIVSATGRKSNEVYRSLRRQIVLAELPAGQQLVELELAKRMNCSQSTVREALMRLQEDGLIVRQGYRGTVVSSVSAMEGQESLDIRARIESRAAHLSIANFTPARVAALGELVRQMEAVAGQGDEYALFELDQAFHHALYEAANLPALMPMLDRCSLCSHRYKITQSTTRRTLRDTALRHWKIVEAVKSGQAAELERVLFHHVSSVIGDADAARGEPELRMSPAMAAIFLRIQKEDGHLPNPMQIPLDQARINFNASTARWNHIDEAAFDIDDFRIPCADGHALQALRIAPRHGARPGTLVYLHGGGWVFGSVQTHRGAMARLAELSGLSVVGIDYRLAPEAPFPTGLNDAAWAWRWLRAEAAARGSTAPWFVAGDSSGANIALSMMLDLLHAGEALPDAALLFYGVFAANHQTASHLRCGQGQFGLSTEKMAWYRAHYLSGARRDAADPRVSPLLAELEVLAGLPPIFMNAAGLDPLRDDSLLLAQRLAEANVPCQMKLVEGVVHGFMQMSSELPEALASFQDAAAFTRSF